MSTEATDAGSGDLHPAPIVPPPERPAQLGRSWREKRWERRRRRIWFEEILGWILVPTILIACYLFVEMVLGALGTSPSAILNGLSSFRSNF
jgi:hypothetical protein